MRPRQGVLLLSAMLVCLTGCATAPVADPLAVMLDRSRDPVRRLAAAEQMGPIDDAPDPRVLAVTLHNVLWSDGEPTDLRLLAMDRLIAYDPDAFWLIAERRIREVDRWVVLEPLIERAVEQDDPSFTAFLVRSYVRESQILHDDQRPERDAIVALNPGKTIEQAIWDVLVSDDESINIAARVDAWALTNRLFGHKAARALLEDESSVHPMILDLQAAQWLDRLPDNREGVLWLMQLRSKHHFPFWVAARHRTLNLTKDQRDGLELRHLSVLLYASEQQLATDRFDLVKRIGIRIPDQSYQPDNNEMKPISDYGASPLMFPTFNNTHLQFLARLGWSDMLAIECLLDGLRDRELVMEVFQQADADMADTRTEYGGVLAIEDGRLVALPFTPDLRLHDRKFYSSEALIQRMYTGLFHYHFHAQQHHNTDFAKPGLGDMAFAERLHASCLVFTFLDQDTLGLDYYQPDGMVVDLGVIRR